MPSRLGPKDYNERLQERSLAAQYLRTQAQAVFQGPWGGYAPDMIHAAGTENICVDSLGLIARADPNPQGTHPGEVLALDDGSEVVDAANSPIGNDAGSSHVIVRLDQLELTNDDGIKDGEETTTPIALVGGDTTVDSFEMFKLNAAGNWVEVPYLAAGALFGLTATAGRDGDPDDRASMPDSCTFAGGAPARNLSAIATPCFIFTNNVDPVFVYPDATASLNYEELTDDAAIAGGAGEFLCMSVETFKDRVYFLNTSELGVRYKNRLRRTARNTADPLTTAVGAGQITLDQFQGTGLRVETLGDVLVCYFEDGVAFIHETGVATAPNAVQILDTRRGLLGTHSVISVGDNRHFGLFTDGWWFLDSNGRWQEAGISQQNTPKWKETWYRLLQSTSDAGVQYRQRIQMHYDQPKNWVRISFPSIDQPDVNSVWIYDIDSDRVWPDSYVDSGGATCWGDWNLVAGADVDWDGLAGPPDLAWDDLGTWSSYGATFQEKAPVRGTYNGYVHRLSPRLEDRSGVTVPYRYQTMAQDFKQPSNLKILDRVSVEHINAANDTLLSIQGSNTNGTSGGGSQSLNTSELGYSEVAEQSMRVSGRFLDTTISGQGTVKIRSITQDVILEQAPDLD